MNKQDIHFAIMVLLIALLVVVVIYAVFVSLIALDLSNIVRNGLCMVMIK